MIPKVIELPYGRIVRNRKNTKFYVGVNFEGKGCLGYWPTEEEAWRAYEEEVAEFLSNLPDEPDEPYEPLPDNS